MSEALDRDAARRAISAEVPTGSIGIIEVAPGRWVTDRTLMACHEAGHAAVNLAQGICVTRVAVLVDGPMIGGESLRQPETPTTQDEYVQYCRARAISAYAGATAVREVRHGFGITHERWDDEQLSAEDLEGLEMVERLTPEPLDEFRAVYQHWTPRLILQHPVAFGAIVRALVERGELDESELLALWRESIAIETTPVPKITRQQRRAQERRAMKQTSAQDLLGGHRERSPASLKGHEPV